MSKGEWIVQLAKIALGIACLAGLAYYLNSIEERIGTCCCECVCR